MQTTINVIRTALSNVDHAISQATHTCPSEEFDVMCRRLQEARVILCEVENQAVRVQSIKNMPPRAA